MFGLHRRANRKEERRSSPPLRHSFLPGRLLERAATRRKKVISETLSAPRDCLQGVGEGERKGLVQIFFKEKGRDRNETRRMYDRGHRALEDSIEESFRRR